MKCRTPDCNRPAVFYSKAKRRRRADKQHDLCERCNRDLTNSVRARNLRRTNAKMDFAAVVLKGVVEHQDGTAYFGSLSGYKHYEALAIAAGWILIGNEPTGEGRRAYETMGLAALPKTYREGDQ